jgi:hypothetical protein
MREYKERVIGGSFTQGDRAHFQTAWWAGFNDARQGFDACDTFALKTTEHDYLNGYACGQCISTGGYAK